MLAHLLRHGETEGGARYWGGTDVALSPRGWQQMRDAVAGRSWGLIVSSPLRRCAAFAESLARELAVRCRYEADLREMSFGEWEGCSAAELMQTDAERLRSFWSNPSAHTPPGGESLSQLYARGVAAWQRIATDRDNGRVLIVTHGGPMRLLRAVQSARPLSALLSIDVPHGALISIECLADGSVAPDPEAPGCLHSRENC
jgi:alpha-ribazole phosphatase